MNKQDDKITIEQLRYRLLCDMEFIEGISYCAPKEQGDHLRSKIIDMRISLMAYMKGIRDES